MTHPMVVRVAIVHALQLPMAALPRLDVAPLAVVRLSRHGSRWQPPSSPHRRSDRVRNAGRKGDRPGRAGPPAVLRELLGQGAAPTTRPTAIPGAAQSAAFSGATARLPGRGAPPGGRPPANPGGGRGRWLRDFDLCESPTVSALPLAPGRPAARTRGGGGGAARRLAGDGVATVVLVEGVSDRSAVEALAGGVAAT